MTCASDMDSIIEFGDGALLKRLGNGRAVVLKPIEGAIALAFVRPIGQKDVKDGRLILDRNQGRHKTKIITHVLLSPDALEAIIELQEISAQMARLESELTEFLPALMHVTRTRS